ncbi:MAG TPA: AAA family ATPase [Marmoricola sp.]|nr:AAA family ATPase [Marmoricola sp.]
MRLHHLSMTAFGPFVDTAEVDFDQLSAGGLFLLTGATGAGKTSVLDAVCFALYGQVPGDRAAARHLRSDHAPPGLAPRVTLLVSIGDRTLRFTRSPAWSRPKQRGTGETRVQAHVVVEERRAGQWVPLTNRLDDAGLLVGDLLGMTATQFTQVAMLPQGRFQAFLRASSTERHAVLQKLFRTDRFERVERWLVDQRGAARRAAEDAERNVLDVLHRLQEAAGADLPAEIATDIPLAAERGHLLSWARAVHGSTAATADEAQGARAQAELDLTRADDTLAEVRHLHELRDRAEAAADQLVALAGRSEEITGLREQLAAHRRARPVAALIARAVACRQGAERAHAGWLSASRGLDVPAGDDTGPALAELHRAAVAGLAVAEAFRPRAAELDALRARRAHVSRRTVELTETLAGLEDEIQGHPETVRAAECSLAEAEAAIAALPAVRAEVAALRELIDAGRRLDLVSSELEVARADLSQARDDALAAKEHYLAVREARINGMAAELAGALAVGCACPVCGSASHPAPATTAGTTVGRADEEAARRVSEDRAFDQQGQEVRVAGLLAEQASLAGRLAGIERGDLAGKLDAARERLTTSEHLAGARDERARELTELRSRVSTTLETRGRAATSLAASRQEATALGSAADALAAELEALLDGTPDLDALVRERADRTARVEAAMAAFSAYDEARRAAAEADAAVQEAAREIGFPDERAAESALLDAERADEIERIMTDLEARRLAAEHVLADPAVRAAASGELADLDVAIVRQRAAAEAAQAARSVADASAARLRRVDLLRAQLESVLETWRPLRERHALVAGLSQLVEGKGPDNPLRIRLAAYVLSERLRQVVAAANERLATMTAHRYSLEHTDDRGTGEQRGGLSLRVCDEWSGVSRDPATLSGGETFVVSLALALGLADTVAHEAGGTDIDTLFIDEGFGSLDTDTLEDVMDTLDTLRDGGRVVGLVSHVPELRSRITTQLEVAKGRTGSTLRPVVAAG